MLSRLHDERVFTGSHDIVFSESSAHEAQRRLLGEATNSSNGRKQLTRRQRQQIQNEAEQKQEEDDDSDGGDNDGASADMSSNDDGGDDDDEDDDDEEEEELLRNSRHPPSSRYHPQHPYNAQLLALAKNPNNKKPADGKVVHNGGIRKSGAIVYENHPMEFVFLPNGEIVPRDECSPGLALPPPATHASIAASENEQHRHLLAQNAFERSEGMQQQHQQQQQQRQPEAQKTVKTEANHRGAISITTSTSAQCQNANISVVEYTNKDRPARRSRLSSESSESSAESSSPRYSTTTAKRRNNNADVSSANESSDSESSDGSDASDNDDEEEKENARQQAARAAQKQRVQQKSSPKRAAPALKSRPVAAPAPKSSSTSRKQSAEPPSRKQKKKSEPLRAQPQIDDDEEQQQQQPSRRAKAPSQLNAHEKPWKAPLPSPSSASDDSRAAWSRRPKAVKYEDLHSQQQQHHKPTNADEGRVKKSTKMDVRDLLSENSRVKVLKAKPSRDQSEKIELLEQELQKEKKRVLEKMTQLLEEQGKNQQLQHQLDVFQSQLKTKEKEAEVKVKEVLQSKDASFGQVEAQWKARVKALEDQLHVKDAAVLRLQSETEQLKNTVSKLKDRERQSSSQSHERETSANRQLEKIIAKLKKFRARVESWKANSKEAMEVCDRKSDMLSLMDTLWMDFPAFPFLEDSKSNNGEKRDDSTSENTNMLIFLKKRLCLREDELRQTHVKYVELKELCARQCVREADLQNFINEHRLRGNLIIRKDGSTPAENANDGRKNVQFQEQQQQQQRSEAKKKTIVNRATNTSPTYYEEEDSEEEGDRDFDEYEEDEGGRDEQDEEEQQEEYYVREPKVFVQVGRDGVYEHTPPRSSAVLRKLEEEQARHARKKKEPREVERIRLVPSPTLARRYERVPAPSEEYVIAPARQKMLSSNASTPPRSTVNRLSRPPSISATRASGVVRRKSAQMPSAARTNGTRTMSVSSRISRSTVPWV